MLFRRDSFFVVPGYSSKMFTIPPARRLLRRRSIGYSQAGFRFEVGKGHAGRAQPRGDLRLHELLLRTLANDLTLTRAEIDDRFKNSANRASVIDRSGGAMFIAAIARSLPPRWFFAHGYTLYDGDVYRLQHRSPHSRFAHSLARSDRHRLAASDSHSADSLRPRMTVMREHPLEPFPPLPASPLSPACRGPASLDRTRRLRRDAGTC